MWRTRRPATVPAVFVNASFTQSRPLRARVRVIHWHRPAAARRLRDPAPFGAVFRRARFDGRARPIVRRECPDAGRGSTDGGSRPRLELGVPRVQPQDFLRERFGGDLVAAPECRLAARLEVARPGEQRAQFRAGRFGHASSSHASSAPASSAQPRSVHRSNESTFSVIGTRGPV